MTKVSVIVPVYNVEKYIYKCINSLVNQTFKDIEIIIIDDETKDNSIKIINDNFKDERIRIYHQKNSGAAAARNYGIKISKGEYLFFVDSDDFIELNTIEVMYNKIKDNNVNIVICDYYKLMENGNKTHIKMIPHYLDNIKSSVISMPGPVGKLMKKDFFIKYHITFLENHYFEDNAIMPFVCAILGKFIYVERPFYYYLQRDGSSLNKKYYDKKWEDIFDSLSSLYNKFYEYNLIDDFHDELEYIYIEYLLHASSLRFIEYKNGIKNISKIHAIIHEKFPNWKRNKYYQRENIKYKIICLLLYYNQIKLVKLLLRIRGNL